MVDDNSKNYANDWKKRRGEPETTVQFRIDSAKETLDNVLARFLYPQLAVAMDQDGDTPEYATERGVAYRLFSGKEVIKVGRNAVANLKLLSNSGLIWRERSLIMSLRACCILNQQ